MRIKTTGGDEQQRARGQAIESPHAASQPTSGGGARGFVTGTPVWCHQAVARPFVEVKQNQGDEVRWPLWGLAVLEDQRVWGLDRPSRVRLDSADAYLVDREHARVQVAFCRETLRR